MRQFHIAQLIPEPTSEDDRALRLEQSNQRREPPDSPQEFAPPGPEVATIRKREDQSSSPLSVQITETLHPADPRSTSKVLEEAKATELDGLVRRGDFELVDQSAVPPQGNILSGCFVLEIKGSETETTLHKAQFVVQGHRDKEKHMLIYNSYTARPASVRLLVSISSMRRYGLWSFDVAQAYLQSAAMLTRGVYFYPPRELTYPDIHLFLLRKAVYGLSDSGDYWHDTLPKLLNNYI